MRRVDVYDQIKKAFRIAIDIRQRPAALEARRAS